MEGSERTEGNESPTETGGDLAASLEEIEKLDAILKIKVTEEKKARLSRIRAEEESRSVLSKLASSDVPDRIQRNMKRFMTLLDEVATADADSSCFDPQREGVARGEEAIDGGEGKGSGRRQNARRNLKFVERNIRLAKCGRGTLSLTDEEKSRIENLLADGEGAAEESPADARESYAVDDGTKALLGEIDRRLQVLSKSSEPKGAGSESSPPEDVGAGNEASGEGKEEEEEEGGGEKEGRKGEKKKGSRLEEIDKLLSSMNSASEEVICPLSGEEMESLVERSKRSLSEDVPGPSGDGCEWPSAKPPQEVISELVSGAKLLMPKFKYRFDDS